MKIIRVKNSEEGIEICKKLLYEKVSKNSVLFLSGGSTPKALYEILTKEKLLKVGAVALIDERYFSNVKLKTENLKSETNEYMIKQTGLTDYLSKQNIRFYPILENTNQENTAKDYDETMRFIFNYFPKSIGILGVGIDGHTAGIPAITEISQKIIDDKSSLASFYNDQESFYKQRITLTFLGLSKLDEIIVLVFGKDKKKALKLMFEEGSLAKIPARFFNTQEITDKVILITDQIVK
jgi:6-phosphogluconolactonase/glucosamine-6-phosphate isomerase/deaminase